MAQKIDKEYIKVGRIQIAIAFSMMFLVLSLLILIFFGFRFTTAFFITLGLLGGILLILYLFLTFVYANKAIENYSFQLEDEGIRIISGVIRKSQKFIPYRQIEHLEIRRGIFDRHFGFSTIVIDTAGHAGGYGPPEGMIPGLRNPDPIMEEIRIKMEKSS